MRFINALIVLLMISAFAIVFAVISCEDNVIAHNKDISTKSTTAEPSTQVYVQGQNISSLSAEGTAVASATADAYFYVRVDSRIPTCGAMPASKYFPQTASGNSIFVSGNKGKIDTNYPYKSGTEYGYTGYVYDTEGKATLNAIVEAPELSDLLAANRNYTWGDLAGLNTDTLKVMWYIVKKEGGIWHVDGVLTGVHTQNIVEVPGVEKDDRIDETTVPDVTPDPVTPDADKNVEVDIHQQKHQDWDEIKTSIHIRDLVDTVTVTIPIGRDYMAEADDFAIREYTFWTDIAHLQTSHPIKVTVSHELAKLVITVTCADTDYIKYLFNKYGDGVTVEVHSYIKNMSKADAWSLLKQSEVYASPATHVIYNGPGSAYFDY